MREKIFKEVVKDVSENYKLALELFKSIHYKRLNTLTNIVFV